MQRRLTSSRHSNRPTDPYKPSNPSGGSAILQTCLFMNATSCASASVLPEGNLRLGGRGGFLGIYRGFMGCIGSRSDFSVAGFRALHGREAEAAATGEHGHPEWLCFRSLRPQCLLPYSAQNQRKRSRVVPQNCIFASKPICMDSSQHVCQFHGCLR